MKPDQERVRHLLTDTVTLLCKNGLQFNKEIKVQGLLGITLDQNEVFLVHIDETIGSLLASTQSTTHIDLDRDDITQQQQQQLLSVSESTVSNGQTRPVPCYLGKMPARPLRPASRFAHRFGPALRARRIQHTQSAQKNVQLSQCMPTHPNRVNASQSLTDNASLESGAHDNQRLPRNGDNVQTASRSEFDCRERVEIKAEQEDDDIIIVDQKLHSDEMQLQERKAMLGSYLTEVSVSESSMAQDILSAFSVGEQGGGNMSAEGTNDGGTTYVSGLMKNFQQPGDDGGSSSLMVQQSSWDIPSSSQLSTIFGASGSRSTSSVGLLAFVYSHAAVKEWQL